MCNVDFPTGTCLEFRVTTGLVYSGPRPNAGYALFGTPRSPTADSQLLDPGLQGHRLGGAGEMWDAEHFEEGLEAL